MLGYLLMRMEGGNHFVELVIEGVVPKYFEEDTFWLFILNLDLCRSLEEVFRLRQVIQERTAELLGEGPRDLILFDHFHGSCQEEIDFDLVLEPLPII